MSETKRESSLFLNLFFLFWVLIFHRHCTALNAWHNFLSFSVLSVLFLIAMYFLLFFIFFGNDIGIIHFFVRRKY